MSSRRGFRLPHIALLAVLGWACTETVVAVVDVASVDVQPRTASVVVGGSVPLGARVTDDRGNQLNGRSVTWSSANPQIATVSAQGVVRGVAAGATDITAASEGVQSTARVTVSARPLLQVAPDSVVFSTVRGTSPAPATVQVNATGGNVDGLALAIEYESGASGWLDAALSDATTPATLTVSPDPSALAAGSYRATIRLTATDAANTPVVIPVRVVVTPAPASRLTLAGGAGQSAIAGTVLPTPVGVRVTDAAGDPLAGIAVTFSIAAGGGSLASNAPVATGSDGIALAPAWTLGTVAGTNILRATATALPGDTVTVSATGVAGPASQLTMTTQPSATAVSGATFPRQPAVQLRDVHGNMISAAGVSVTATLHSGGGTLAGTTVVATDAAGLARFTDLAITGGAGDKQLRFASGSLVPAISANITITAGSGTQLSLMTQPSSSAQSGVPFAVQPVLQLQDAGGNPVAQAGVLVTAAIATGGGTLGGSTTATTDAAGTAHFTGLSISGTIGDRTLRFTAGGITAALSGTVTITTGPPSAAHSAASAPNGIAGNTTPISISVRDDGGNPVTGAAAQLAVTIRGANSATPTVTETGGGAYAASYVPTATGTDSIFVTLGGTAIAGTPFTSAVTSSGVSGTLSTVGAAPATGILANGQASSTITIRLRDPLNNPVSGLAGSINVQLTGSASASSAVETATPGTYTLGLTSTVANVVNVVVSAGAVTLSDQPAVQFVAGAVAPGSSTTTASPATGVTADGSATSTVTVTLKDAFNNPITGLSNASFVIALTGSAQRSAVSAGAAPGTYSFTVTNTVAQTVTVTVTAAGVSLTQQPTIQFVTGGVSAALSTAAANPATGVTANGVAASTITVALKDANGNAITGLTAGNFTIGLTGSAQASTIAQTATPGTYAFTMTSTAVGIVTVTITANGVQLTQQPTIQFVPGNISATVSTAVANPSTAVSADGSTASTVTVVLSDATGNAITGLTAGNFVIGITGSAQASAIAETGTPGTYTFAVTNTAVETVTVTITANGVQLVQQPTIQFTTGGISATLSTATASPSTGVPADGATASTVTVTLRDASSHPITGLTAGDFAIGISGSAQAGAIAETGTPGTYTFTVTNTVAHTVTVTVTASGVQLTQQPTIQFVPGNISATVSTATANPSTGVSADGSTTSTVTVVLADANGNAITGLTAGDFVIGITGSAQASAIAETGTPGTYTFTVTNTVIETVIVTITANGVQLAQQPTVQFVTPAVSATLSTATASPSTGVPADGSTASTVTVTLKDANGNAITGLAAGNFTIGLTGSAQASVIAETGTPGTYTFTVTNTVAQTVTVTVTANGIQLSQQPTIQFVPGTVSATVSTAVANPSSGVSADGSTASTVTVVLADANGNAITGLTAGNFVIGITGSAQASAIAETGTPGTYTFTVTNTVIETVTVTVTANGVQLVQQPTIQFTTGSISATLSTATASPSTGVPADGATASTVTVTLRDASSHPITGLTAGDFVIGLTGSAQAGAIAETGTPGTYTFTVTNTVAQTVTVTVTASGVQLTQQPTIQFVPGNISATVSTAVANPSTGVSADGSTASTVTVVLADANGNAITGLTAGDFVIGITGSAQASAIAETGTPGTYTFTVTNTVAETVTVTITASGVQLTQQPTIQFTSGVSATLSTAAANPSTGVAADGSTASTVTVDLRDVTGTAMTGLAAGDFTIGLTGSAQQASAIAETATPGTYTFTVTNTAVETITVTIAANGVQLSQQPTIQFVVGSISPTVSTAVANPATGVPADGATASTVTVALRDASGHAITGLTAGDFTIGITGSAQQASAIVESATPGTYTFTVTDLVAETVTVTVTANGVQLSQQPTIGFVAGGVSASVSTATASPSSNVAADGSTASTVTVALRDANGNAIAGLTAGNFSIGLTGSAQQAGAIAETATPGTYTFTVTNTAVETVTVTITANGVQLLQQPTIQFVAGAISPSLSTVVAVPATGVTADGVTQSIVTVTLVDASGNPISGVNSNSFAVTVTGSAVASGVSAGTVPGTYTFSVTNTVAQTVTVTVKARGTTLTQQATIQFIP